MTKSEFFVAFKAVVQLSALVSLFVIKSLDYHLGPNLLAYHKPPPL
jgi:hypothetical protein